MQSQNENGKQQPAAEADLAQNPEISEAWRSLLGLQSAHSKDGRSQTDPATQAQPQTGDPWNMLLQAKGMEAVDLQKIHLHALHPAASDEDIEHALNIIQEATGQSRSQEK